MDFLHENVTFQLRVMYIFMLVQYNCKHRIS